MRMSGIGSRRERVRFTRLGRTRRADGGYDTAPTTLAERWASVVPMQADEQEEAGRLRGGVKYKIEVARYDGLTTDDKIVWLTRDSVELNIRELPLDGLRPLEMTIIAQSGVIQ